MITTKNGCYAELIGSKFIEIETALDVKVRVGYDMIGWRNGMKFWFG
jgi:hypothetical protein